VKKKSWKIPSLFHLSHISISNLFSLSSTRAALPNLPTKEFFTCLLPAKAERAQSWLQGPFSPEHPLGPRYVPPSVVGGLATVASHGPQMRNAGLVGGLVGGLATVASPGPQMRNGGQKLGATCQGNSLTAEQSKRLHELCHARHPESALGFCWNCKRQLPHGYLEERKKGRVLGCLSCRQCKKSFRTLLKNL
jgi:hypothetical protein